jgi:fumarate hydratase class I
MRAKTLEEGALELIRRASCDLPPDVEEAIRGAYEREKKGSPAAGALSVILDNVELARKQSTPICQDTGTNIFHIDYGPEWSPDEIEKAIKAATRKASKKGYLRLNVVNPITGKNTGNNLGIENPQLHFHYGNRKSLKMSLMLKGGGSENVSTQYKLPDAGLKAGRDLDGVRRCVIDAVHKAQGKGCAPGVIAVGIGGDRGSSFGIAKEQLLRKLGKRSKVAELAELEEKLLDQLNSLSIGPMGFGGKTTVLDVLAGHAHRIPASYFVSVAYMCWACRRRTLTVQPDLSWKVR